MANGKVTAPIKAWMLLIVAIMATLLSVAAYQFRDREFWVGLTEGAVLTVSMLTISIYGYDLSKARGWREINAVFLLKLGIVCAWLANAITVIVRIGHTLVDDLPAEFGHPFRPFVAEVIIIAGMLHVAALGLLKLGKETEMVWGYIWLALIGTTVGALVIATLVVVVE